MNLSDKDREKMLGEAAAKIAQAICLIEEAAKGTILDPSAQAILPNLQRIVDYVHHWIGPINGERCKAGIPEDIEYPHG